MLDDTNGFHGSERLKAAMGRLKSADDEDLLDLREMLRGHTEHAMLTLAGGGDLRGDYCLVTTAILEATRPLGWELEIERPSLEQVEAAGSLLLTMIFASPSR